MDKNNRKERPDGKRTAELRLMIEKLEQELAARKQVEGTLQDSQRVSSTLISNLPGMVYRCLNDRQWTLTYISDGCVALTGYQPRDFIENRITYGRLIRPDDQDDVWTMVQAAVRDKKQFALTYRIKAADGEEKWVWEQGRGVFASDGELLFLEGFVTDITERKQAEEALQAFRVLLDHVWDSIEVFDPHTGRFMDGNEKAWSNLVYARHEFLSLSVFDIDPLVTQATFARNMQRLRETGKELLLDSIHRRKDGTTFPAEVSVQLVRYDKEKEYAVAIVRDITERKKMEQALRRSERRMAMLSHRLLEVQEAERRHVARELHDEIGQCLTGLKLGLETALRLRERESKSVLLQLVEQADSLISKSRELSLDLRPAMLDDMGLLPALLFHFERFMKQFGLQVRFEHRKIEGRFHPCLETAAFRIVQEALTNVARHAQAEEAMVTIMADEDGLTVQVKDEGVGFDPDKIIASGKAVGLSGIRERAILLGGHCDVESAPGTGTQVRVRFPFSEVAKREALSRAGREKHD